MQIKTHALRVALSTISCDSSDSLRSGVFTDLNGALHFAVAKLPSDSFDSDSSRLRSVRTFLNFAARDLSNIETLFERLCWQHDLWVKNELPDGKWYRYATADIDMLHVESRSLFDYLSQVIRRVSDKPDQVLDDSFEKLRNWAANIGNRNRIGADLADLLLKCDWFALIKSIRDGVVHNGNQSCVFLDKPQLCFQIYRGTGYEKFIDLPEIMANDNVVDFHLYAGMIYGYILDYLAEVSLHIYQRLKLERNPGCSRHHSPGIRVGKEWIMKLLQKCEAS